MHRPSPQRPAQRPEPRRGFDELEAASDSSFSQRGVNQRGRGPRGHARSDERLRADICELLSEDPDLDASEIEVAVHSGHVLLSGTLDQRWQKHHAEHLAARCSGVRDVENRICVHKRDATGDASAATVSLHGAHGKAVGGMR